MKKRDESNKNVVGDNASSYNSYRMSNNQPSETGGNSDEGSYFRHGYGI